MKKKTMKVFIFICVLAAACCSCANQEQENPLIESKSRQEGIAEFDRLKKELEENCTVVEDGNYENTMWTLYSDGTLMVEGSGEVVVADAKPKWLKYSSTETSPTGDSIKKHILRLRIVRVLIGF